MLLNPSSTSLPLSIPPTFHDSEQSVEHLVDPLGDIARQESHDKISVLLKQCVIMPVTSVGVRIGQVLVSVKFDNYPQVRA